MAEFGRIISHYTINKACPDIDGKPTGKTESKSWWFRAPWLILNNDPYIPKDTAINEMQKAQLCGLTAPLFNYFIKTFSDQGCQVDLWDDGKPKAISEGKDIPEKNSSHAVMINPVFLGSLPERFQEAMRSYTDITDPSKDDLGQFVTAGRESLPEVKWPLGRTIGDKICKKLEIASPAAVHPNYINAFFIDDTKGLYRNLPDEAKQFLHWILMAKFGSFMVAVVPYYQPEDSKLYAYDNPVLASFEGAHPNLNVEAFAKQLLIFGSAKKVGGVWEGIKKDAESYLRISKDDFHKSPIVQSLKGKFGKFLEKYNLISSPINIHDLVLSDFLKLAIIEMSKFSQQAEGAFMRFDPSLAIDVGLPWTGNIVITRTGGFGAVKTDLKDKDLLVTAPLKEKKGDFEEKKIGVILVEGQDIKKSKPSVEAEEFTHPLLDLATENPNEYLIRCAKNVGGYKEDKQGDLVFPLVRGVTHLHRGFHIKENSDKVFEVSIDPNEFPRVGCGVDLMDAMSKYAIKKAYEMWKARGKKDVCAVVEVPEHGTNIIHFWAEENGVIPEDADKQFMDLVEQGEMKFTRKMRQHNSPAPIPLTNITNIDSRRFASRQLKAA